MSKSILVKEYNKANFANMPIKEFFETIDVSFLDILNSNEVEVEVKDYKDCLCKDSHNLNDYFIKCSKCNGKGVISLNEHEVTCNECKGEKYLRIHDCYLCNNEGKILTKSKLKIKLKDSYKQGEIISYENEGYKLNLKLNIYDYDDYLLKGNDVYYLRSVFYSKQDFLNKVSKEIRTVKGKEYLKSEFKVRKEIRCLENKGYNGGNFYFIFINEIENERKTIYTNVLIKDKGYVLIEDLIDKEIVTSKEIVPLNASNYFYIDETIKEYIDDNYRVIFNKLDKDLFYLNEENKLVYVLKLDKDDLNNDKKNFVYSNERVNVNFKKNLKETTYIKVNEKIVVNKNGKKGDLIIKVIPYFENIYKISIKRNKGIVYVDDYAYDDYRLVESFKKKNYLENYLEIKDEEELFVDNNLVLIKRV